jgi:hypothetical protein
MIIGFSGHRDKFCNVNDLYYIRNRYRGAIWCHGGASGFDTQVDNFAKENNISVIVMRPDYDKYKDKPKYAPLARNKEIVNKSAVMVFLWDGRKEGGTYFTYQYTLEKGVDHILLREGK